MYAPRKAQIFDKTNHKPNHRTARQDEKIMAKKIKKDEWVIAAEMTCPKKIHKLAIKSTEILTAFALVENSHTSPETLAALAELWHYSNRICEQIASDLRTPLATLEAMTKHSFGSRHWLAKNTIATKKQAQ